MQADRTQQLLGQLTELAPAGIIFRIVPRSGRAVVYVRALLLWLE